MSFHEKSAWACLVGIVVVFVPYFVVVFQHPMAFVGLLIVASLLLAILLGVFHGMNAIATRAMRQTADTPVHDEMDRMIELKAAKIAGVVLGFAVAMWCVIVMYGVPAMGIHEIAAAHTNDIPNVSLAQFAIPVLDVLAAIHALFAAFVFANIVYYGSIVAAYRRMAHG